MKVKELIEMLQKENQEAIVVMSSDGEGNSYSPVADIGDVDRYKAHSTWSGEVGYSKLTPKMKEDAYSEEDLLTDGEPAVVIFPVN